MATFEERITELENIVKKQQQEIDKLKHHVHHYNDYGYHGDRDTSEPYPGMVDYVVHPRTSMKKSEN